VSAGTVFALVACGLVAAASLLVAIAGTIGYLGMRTQGPDTKAREATCDAPVELDPVDEHAAEAALPPDHPLIAEVTDYLREQTDRRRVWGPFTTRPAAARHRLQAPGRGPAMSLFSRIRAALASVLRTDEPAPPAAAEQAMPDERLSAAVAATVIAAASEVPADLAPQPDDDRRGLSPLWHQMVRQPAVPELAVTPGRYIGRHHEDTVEWVLPGYMPPIGKRRLAALLDDTRDLREVLDGR